MKTKFQYILMTVAMVAMASCSQDEVLIPSAEVQDIRIVVSDFPAFDDAQTRAIGTFDSGKTAWVPDDVIYIVAANKGVDSQILTLTYGADGEWTADGTTIHYLSVSDTHIRAIYAPNCEKEDTEIKAKDNLPYGTGEFLEKECFVENGTLTVDFTNYERPYSRLRIAGLANQTLTVTTTDFTPAGVNNSSPESGEVPQAEGSVTYTLTADDKGNAYLYGTFAANGTVEVVGGVTVQYRFTETTVAGNSYALFARRGANLAKRTETYVINDNETHYFYGSGNYGIKVESGSPTIVLSNANISLNAGDKFESAVNAIDIVATNSTTTIRVEGTENNITAQYGAGIFVAQGSKVEITSSDRSNVLRVTGKGSGSAIGGYASSYDSFGINCGDISISKVTLYATSDFNNEMGVISPAIGGSGNASCGTIEVNDATIYAYGVYCSDNTNTPAIGLGQTNGGQTNNTIPTIKIIDSQIYAYRGGTYADYIGKPQTKVSTSLNLGSDGSAKNSTIYCYTGTAASSVDKAVFYDANGVATEKPAE